MKQGTHKPKPQQKEAQRGQHHNKHQNKPKAESKRPVFASQITPEQNQEQQEASNQLTNEHQDASHGNNTNYEKPYIVVGVNDGPRPVYQDPFYANNPDYKKPYTVVGVNDGVRSAYQDPFYANNPDYKKPYTVVGLNKPVRSAYDIVMEENMAKENTATENKINTNNTQAYTQSLSQQSPTNFIEGLQDTTAANTALQSEKTNLKHSLPQVEQPTGLNTQAKGTTKNVQNQAKTQQAKQKAKTTLPNLSPTGKTQGTQIDTTVEQPTGDTNLAVNTNLGNAPTVDLQGQANPQHNASFQSESTQEVNKQLASTQAQSEVYTGENHIRPEVDKEILSPSITLAEIPTTAGLTDDVTLSSEVQHTFNTEAQASLDAQLQPGKAKQEAAYQQLLSDQEQEKTNTDAKITAETQAVKQQQQQAQDNAKQTVKGHKKAWKAEAKAVKDEFSSKSEAEKAKTDAIIDTEITQADTKVEQTYDTAQKKAEAEVATSEQETQNQSWWDKAKSAVSNFFDKLKTTVNSIIEKAKTLVNTIIDTARNVIVAAIKSFGTVLKAFVSIAFAAFPSISTKFNTLIDTAIHKAVTVVNTLAKGLKKTVNTLLDGLGKVLDFILTVYQKTFKAFMDVVKFIAVGLLEILKGLTNLGQSALEMSGNFMGQVSEEFLGMDVSKPLPFEKTVSNISEVDTGEFSTLLDKSSYTQDDFAVNPIQNDLELSPELMEQLLYSNGDEISFGDNNQTINDFRASAGSTSSTASTKADTANIPADPYGQVDWFINYQNSQAPVDTSANNADGKQDATNDSFPEHMKLIGPLTAGARLYYLKEQMWAGITKKWQDNKLKYIGIGAAVVLGITALAIATAGAIFALIPPALQILAAVMLGAALVKATSFFKQFMVEGWAGKIVSAGKALARALAIILMELIFILLFDSSALFKVLKAGVKNGVKGVTKLAVQGAKNTAKAIGNAGRNIGKGVVKQAGRVKFAVQGISKNTTKGVKNFKQWGKNLSKRFKFKGFKIVLKGKRFYLYGITNPKVLLATGEARDLTPKEVKKLKSQGGNKQLIGKKLDDGIVVSDDYAKSFADGKSKDTFEELLEMDASLIRRLKGNLQGTKELRKGIDGLQPKNFQAHHVIPRELQKVYENFFKKIGFNIENGKFNGIMVPPNDEVLKIAKQNESIGKVFDDFAFHQGSHPDYTDIIREKLRDISLNLKIGNIDDGQALKSVLDIIDQAKSAISNGKGQKINNLSF